MFLATVVFSTLVLGLAWTGEGLAHLARAVDLHRTATTRVRDIPVAAGPIELAGVARAADGPVPAPFSGTPCLVCEYEAVQSGGRMSWTIADGRVGSRFLLEDDMGTVLLDAPNALLNAEEQFVDLPRDEADAPAAVRMVLANHPDLRYGDLRGAILTERRIESGDSVHAYGMPRYDVPAGQQKATVNAVLSTPAPPTSLHSRLRTWMTGVPFVISTGDERASVRRLIGTRLFELLRGVGTIVVLAYGLFFL